MVTRLLFYLILYPLSLLPLRVIYTIFYPFYLLLFYLVKYRKEVVISNLKNSCPSLSEEEILKITKQYYHHLIDLAAEMVKMLTISQREVAQRYTCSNAEVLLPYFQQNKSVILLSSHYNNWEWMVLWINSLVPHQGVGVGKPNTNKVFEKLINKARTRYGSIVIFQDTVRNFVKENIETNTPCAYMMLSDQSPNNISKSYVTTFLNQPTAMIYGGEYFAKKYDLPVFYYVVNKIKRGYYRLDFSVVEPLPMDAPYGTIVEKYVAKLEETITNNPPYWLWSHKRWKCKDEVLLLMNQKNS